MRTNTITLASFVLVFAIGCEGSAPAAPGSVQISGVREACSAWCNPVTGCGTGGPADGNSACLAACERAEEFQAPVCTLARQDFYNCQLDFQECDAEENCRCDPMGFCGESVVDNQFVDQCEADLAELCTECDNEASVAACRLVGTCPSDARLALCAGCIDFKRAYRECLSTAVCPEFF